MFALAKFDSSPAERDSTLLGRERAREPVSEMEREITMRNLVDMQRKVEQRQQRDKERQLLRVREMWRRVYRSVFAGGRGNMSP